LAHAPRTQRVATAADLDRIEFDETGVAAVTLPADLLPSIPFKNAEREESPRLDRVRRSIAGRGYDPTEPIVVRVGQKGKWVVVDGGHRLTAVRRILGSWWARLWSKRIGDLYFLLFLTPRSYTKGRGAQERRAGAPVGPPPAVDLR
jgi:hypothetical protein